MSNTYRKIIKCLWYCFLLLLINTRKILEHFLGYSHNWLTDNFGEKYSKHHSLSLDPHSLWLIFSGKLSGSKNTPQCPIKSCKKLGRSLKKEVLEKRQKTLKISHLIPIIPGFKDFQKSNLAHTKRPIVLYIHAKNLENH